MNLQETGVGVDGCKAGWFSIAIDDDGAWSFAVDSTFARLWSRWCGASSILIDIPIGLRDGGVERECDRAARRQLGARRSSVFPAPCRVALPAGSYAEASALNRAVSGRGLSQQTWHILPKIAEVDALLRADEAAREMVREVHPEVLFWALNDGEPMAHRKKSSAGFDERRMVLDHHFAGASDLLDEVSREYRRYEVARDDIVDALAAAVTGWKARGIFRTIPEDVETDREGLRMEMVY